MRSNTISKPEPISNDLDVRILAVNWNEQIIGYLMKESQGDYFFKYDYKGIQEARKNGYQYLIGFKDTRKLYVSKELFPVFKSRIPTKQRRDLSNILENLGIEDYDEFDLLASSGGRLLTDSISFKEYVPEKIKDRTRRANADIRRALISRLSNRGGMENSGR